MLHQYIAAGSTSAKTVNMFIRITTILGMRAKKGTVVGSSLKARTVEHSNSNSNRMRKIS